MTTDNSKLVFNSALRYEYIASKGSIAFSVAAWALTTYSVTHNLGYEPFFKCFYTYGAGKYFKLFAGTSSYGIGGNGGQIDNVYVDTTKLYISVSENNGTPISGTIYYRIYAEPQT